MGTVNRKEAHKAKRENLLGSVCCNCGKECGAEIEYHHIVPLEHGGNDIISNLAPICYECHTKVHFLYERKKPERTGRKRKEYDQELCDRVFTGYVKGTITEIEARRQLGTGQHIREMIVFKEWAERNGITVKGSHFGHGGPQ